MHSVTNLVAMQKLYTRLTLKSLALSLTGSDFNRAQIAHVNPCYS